MVFDLPLKLVMKIAVQPMFRLVRGQTMGVRGLVLDEDNNVLLVRHSYYPGWTFPGGGVERAETLNEAIKKELDEETGVQVHNAPELFGIYANFKNFKGDHVALFIVREWDKVDRKSLEIAEYGFFGLDNLPEDTTPGTKRRLHEVLSSKIPAEHW